MKIKQVTEQFSISDQLMAEDVDTLADAGVEILICNRPDGEAAEQINFAELADQAESRGIKTFHIPFKSGHLDAEITREFGECLEDGKRIHAFCRTGTRSFSAYVAAQARQGAALDELLALAKKVDIDVSEPLKPYFPEIPMDKSNAVKTPAGAAKASFDVVIVGAGSGGIAAASSIKKRNKRLSIALIDPASDHYYQPGWTMVGGGIFDAPSTRRSMESLIPTGVKWIQQAVSGFDPKANEVQLDNGDSIHYQNLIVAPGLKLNWAAIDGLEQTLGKNGVTSNYRYDLAPYTFKLVSELKQGTALFTQPPMPIKCAGAPQKAMYLSCDQWLKKGVLKDIDVHFLNAGGVLFGVSDYVPALQSYVDRYDANLHFNHNLIAIDGENRVATFKAADSDEPLTMEFDMIHVCPPQCAPEFVANSELADEAGWLDVDQFTLRHKKFDNVWGLGDVMNTPNAKTMAAVRKQVPVVASNLIATLAGQDVHSGYDGYGSCPLTVENGKIVLAEFGYGGKLLPSFPTWILNGTRPTRSAWILKKQILPTVYWQGMLKGHEWLAGPRPLKEVQS
jgi:sulfide:quinone oxidoreductase